MGQCDAQSNSRTLGFRVKGSTSRDSKAYLRCGNDVIAVGEITSKSSTWQDSVVSSQRVTTSQQATHVYVFTVHNKFLRKLMLAHAFVRTVSMLPSGTCMSRTRAGFTHVHVYRFSQRSVDVGLATLRPSGRHNMPLTRLESDRVPVFCLTPFGTAVPIRYRRDAGPYSL
eukprot:366552-Chlamydomonas_euryale.AAC.10